jgi:hypothetical protein
MDYDLFKIVGAVAGIGGISLGAIVYIFREVIRKEIFPQLTKEQSYKLLNRIVILTFIVGVLGVGAYLIVNWQNGNRNVQTPVSNQKTTSNNGYVEQTFTPTPVISNKINNNLNSPPPSPSPVIIANTNNNRTVQTPSPTPFMSRLSGIVFDENDKTVQGAKITVDDFPEMKPVETTSNGVFILESIPRKADEFVRIRVSMNGYKTHVRDVVIGRSSPRINLEKIK